MKLNDNDQELTARAWEGDNNAFNAIIKKFERQVAATVIGMLGYCTEAEDIGQETFIRFYRSLDKFRGDASVGTYLTRIAINLSLNELKRRQRGRKLFSSKSEEKIENVPDKNSAMKNKDIKEIVQRGIEKLEPKLRSVIVLRLINGYSTKETANILSLPLGTVLSRLARAQMRLKEILTPLYGGES
ncbi:MAG: sigma-70 family RNA polymerase sigma factor [Candidatus Aminicenantes bacterium]|nr:MAG: sigma-70 family RNA polymerase sigma factor [Candidatus Aminicenantes bacterium]